MRAFVAGVMPDAVVESCDRWISALAAGSGGALRPVPQRSAHLTLAFLGEIADGAEAIGAVTRAVAEAAEGVAAIAITLDPPVILQDRRQPRLVMARVGDGADAMRALAEAVTAAIRRTGLAEIGDPKPAHVTLARFSKHATAADAQRVFDLIAQAPDAPRAARVEAVRLMRSTLGPSGPAYDTLSDVRLG